MSCSSTKIFNSPNELLKVQKPAQYLGGEHNSVMKSEDEVDVRMCLAFPDAYEVGMSHLGYQILYDILNQEDGTWAERAYMPLPDMENLIHEKGSVLTSLEAKRPLVDFDILGFTLQYELCATNILAMLDLAGIPRRAIDRTEEHPLVIGGGPFSYHPEAVAPFFDAFLLGDAEEAVLDITAAVRKIHKLDLKRADLLEELFLSEGIYIPAKYQPSYNEDGTIAAISAPEEKPQVVRRLLPSLSGAPFPRKPVVPNIKTVHNRLSVEVMRGCVRGCRFCQAGYLYRPQRERSPREIVDIVQGSLPETGFEELSLLSLSTADYCSVVPLLKELMNEYGEGDKLAISFPSTRVDALTPEVLEQVQRVRRTGFTVAPEAGTQRLRDVINKGVTDEEITQCCKNVFDMGWTGIKLYFMIGLPTETDEDLQGIIDTAARVKSLEGARGQDITVSVSTHVPKPHTPFQWCAQISPEETVRRQRFLAQGLKKVGVNFRYHDAFSSFLEGIFCRADRRFADVIERAYESGCRLDGWAEHTKEDLWSQAFLDLGVDPYWFLRERGIDETLPWDHLSCGIPKSYFQKENKRALRDRTTPDCLKTSCSICGACNYDDARNVLWPRHETEQVMGSSTSPISNEIVEREPLKKLRIKYGKRGHFSLIGHLEIKTVLFRALRRAEIPLSYTKGFHPQPKVSFGPPLQLGIESMMEYADLYLDFDIEPGEVLARINDKLQDGLKILDCWEVPLRGNSLQELISEQTYRVEFLVQPGGILSAFKDMEETHQAILAHTIERKTFNKKGRRRKPKLQNFLLSEYIQYLDSHREPTGELKSLTFSLKADPSKASPRPLEIIISIADIDLSQCRVVKTQSRLQDELPTVNISGRQIEDEFNELQANT